MQIEVHKFLKKLQVLEKDKILMKINKLEECNQLLVSNLIISNKIIKIV